MFGGLMRCPMLIRIVVGRSWGQGAQHSQSPQATFAHYPGLTVVMPSSSQAILDMYPAIINRHPGPVISIEHRLLYNLDFTVSPSDQRVPLTSYVARKGSDVTVVATSVMVLEALRAAQYVEDKAGISAEVIDLNSISHPDWDLVAASVARTGRLVVADTSWLEYGVAAEVCRQLVMRDPGLLRQPPTMLGMAPAPCPTAKSLEDIYYPSQHETVDAILTQVKGDKHGIALPVERSMTEGLQALPRAVLAGNHQLRSCGATPLQVPLPARRLGGASRIACSLSQPLPLAGERANVLFGGGLPRPVLPIPLERSAQAVLERRARLEAELAGEGVVHQAHRDGAGRDGS